MNRLHILNKRSSNSTIQFINAHTHRETHRTSLGFSFSFVLSIKDKWFFCKFELKRKAHSVVFVLFVHIHDRESRLWFQFHIRNANTHSRTCIVYVQLICVRSKKWYTRSHTHTRDRVMPHSEEKTAFTRIDN